MATLFQSRDSSKRVPLVPDTHWRFIEMAISIPILNLNNAHCLLGVWPALVLYELLPNTLQCILNRFGCHRRLEMATARSAFTDSGSRAKPFD
jgi:hypothetical protein